MPALAQGVSTAQRTQHQHISLKETYREADKPTLHPSAAPGEDVMPGGLPIPSYVQALKALYSSYDCWSNPSMFCTRLLGGTQTTIDCARWSQVRWSS